MIARRGAKRCLNLTCDGYAYGGDYCKRCSALEEVRRDHNGRLKQMEVVWNSAVPHLLNTPSKVRERRLNRSPVA